MATQVKANGAADTARENQTARLLEANDLHTSFFTPAGEVKAVNGVSFNLDRRKVFAQRKQRFRQSQTLQLIPQKRA